MAKERKKADDLADLRKIDAKVGAQLNQLLSEGEVVIRSAPADLSLDGVFTAGAVSVTDRRLIAIDPAHTNGYLAIDRADICKTSIEAMYGNCLLTITTAGQEIEVSRFTNTVRDLFDDLCRELNGQLEDESTAANGADKTKSSNSAQLRCPRCGRTLPRQNAVCPFCIDKRKVIARLLSYARPHRKLALIGLLFSLIATAASLAPPYFTRILVDEVVLKKDLNLLWIMVCLLLLTYLVHAVFNGLRTYRIRVLSQKIVYDIRTQVFAKMQRLAVNYFDKRSTGAIMSRVSNDTQQLQGFIVQATQNVVVQMLTLLIIGLVMFSMHWQLALIALLPIPLVTLGARIFVKKIHPVYHRVWRRRSRVNAILGDSIPGIRVIKAFTGEDRTADHFNATSSELLKEQIRAAHMASLFSPTIGFLMMLSGIIIWGLGGYWVITDPTQLSLGVLVAFISYAWRFFAPIQFLAGLSDMLQQATTSAERVFEVIDDKPEPNYGRDKVIDHLKGELEFRNVTFSYEQDKKALDHINLKIKPGETVGIVGATGSGKSTFANMILRFYDPDEGEILLDGVNINDLDIQFLRANTGFVLQEPLLFRDTISNNIAYSKPDATTEEILDAAMAANAHPFISDFPDAYDTRVGERGVGLSGGERQRISIARAIIKNPAILILDEATASVDTETEQLIQEAINRLIENRTTVMIAHRLSTLRKADRIIVIEQGQIAESGTHDELMAKQGIFYKLIKLQTDLGADLIQSGEGAS